MVILRTTQLTSTALPRGTATIGSPTVAIQRATQTSTQQIASSAARTTTNNQNATVSLSRLPTTPSVTSTNITSTNVANATTATQIIRNSTVVTVALAQPATVVTARTPSAATQTVQTRPSGTSVSTVTSRPPTVQLQPVLSPTVSVAQPQLVSQPSRSGASSNATPGIIISIPVVEGGGKPSPTNSSSGKPTSGTTTIIGAVKPSPSTPVSLTEVAGRNGDVSFVVRSIKPPATDDSSSTSNNNTGKPPPTSRNAETTKSVAESISNKTSAIAISNIDRYSTEVIASKTNFDQDDSMIIQTEIANKNITPLIAPTPIIETLVLIPETQTVISSIVAEDEELTSTTSAMTYSDPVLFSGSFAIGSDTFNLDTPEKDLRSYSAELLSSFDQLASSFTECEIITVILDPQTGKVVIPFRLGIGNQFMIKMSDMFYDRKVFYNGFSTIDSAHNFINTSFKVNMTAFDPPSDILLFSREQAKEATIRNKNLLSEYGINTSLNFTIFGEDEDKIKAKKLLEVGVFDYGYNSFLQDDSIYVHKIYCVDVTAIIRPPIASTTSTSTATATGVITAMTPTLITMPATTTSVEGEAVIITGGSTIRTAEPTSSFTLSEVGGGSSGTVTVKRPGSSLRTFGSS
jgi:hypothetical protein